MRLLAVTAVSVFVLVGCASTPSPKPSELMSDVKRVAFVQHGAGPLRTEAAGVDGKTLWGGSNVALQPGTSARADVQGAAAGNVVLLIGGAIAREAMKEDPQLYERTMRGMIGERPISSEISAAVFPEIATAWGTTFQPDSATYLAADVPLATPEGLYAGKAVDADLVIVYSLESMVVMEKFSAGTLFRAVAMLGLGDRNVFPSLNGSLTVFKRDQKGDLRQVWRTKCPMLGYFGSAPDVKWSTLVENPAAAAPLFDAAIPLAIGGCKRAIAARAG